MIFIIVLFATTMIHDTRSLLHKLLTTILGSDVQFTFSFQISCYDFNDCPAPVTNPPTLSPTEQPSTRPPTFSTSSTERQRSGIPIKIIIIPSVAATIVVFAFVLSHFKKRNSAAGINRINMVAQPIVSTTNTNENNIDHVAQPTTMLFGKNSKAPHTNRPFSHHDASVSYSANTYSQASAPPQGSKPLDGKSLFDQLNNT